MGQGIMETIFAWFQGLFGVNLGNHLAGLDCNFNRGGGSFFETIGWIIFGISLFLVVLYYFVITLRWARLVRWYHWLIMLGVSSVIALIFGYVWTHNDLINSNILPCFQYATDSQTGQLNYSQPIINDGHCFGFGIACLFVSAIFFTVQSFILKWFSQNGKHSPII